MGVRRIEIQVVMVFSHASLSRHAIPGKPWEGAAVPAADQCGWPRRQWRDRYVDRTRGLALFGDRPGLARYPPKGGLCRDVDRAEPRGAARH